MKCYFFNVEERATYFQEGTVYVIANSEAEAKSKCLAGEYVHTGDNKIDWNSEQNTVVIDAKLDSITDATDSDVEEYNLINPQ